MSGVPGSLRVGEAVRERAYAALPRLFGMGRDAVGEAADPPGQRRARPVLDAVAEAAYAQARGRRRPMLDALAEAPPVPVRAAVERELRVERGADLAGLVRDRRVDGSLPTK